MNLVLGIGDYGASNNPSETIKTYALGSCVAAVILDASAGVAGMVHVALPDSTMCPDRADKVAAGYFADRGIPLLLERMAGLGAADHRRMIVKLIGGATVVNMGNKFNIGKRNVMAIRKILWQYGMGPRAEDVGGTSSRTVSVLVGTCEITIANPQRETWSI